MERLEGNSLDTLFVYRDVNSRRASSYDRSGGNHDWIEVEPGGEVDFAVLAGAGIVRHIWCTTWVVTPDRSFERHYLRKIILRAYWDGEVSPSVQAPLGDFFGIGHGISKNYSCAPLAMSPEDGRAFNCFFPMPFAEGARFTLENNCEHLLYFYFYIDYEEHKSPADDMRFHASWRRERDTGGWAPKQPGFLDEKAGVSGEPDWLPKAWLTKNTDGRDNYVILEAEGRGKYVGCNLNIDVFERQANDWYGEGDDMVFIDGEAWPPSLHGTGTEDYFGTAFCPTTEFCAPYHGITVYNGDKAGFKWGGKNSMYRYHIRDPIYFGKSIRVSIEHGHANKLSNDYSSTAYWYQSEPHKLFLPMPLVSERLPRINAWEE